jgi:hypothetical protein
MTRNGVSGRADSGSGRWGAAKEGIGCSSAVSRGKGQISGMDAGAATGGSVEGKQKDVAAAAGKKRLKLANPALGS